MQGRLMAPLWAGLENALITGDPAAPAVFGASFYEHLGSNPDLDGHWNRAMAQTALAWFDDDGLLGVVDWAGLSLVVDVGGGLGAMLAILLRRHRHLRGLLYDQANALQGAAAFLEASGVANRVEVSTGSFFESVPAGADLYLLARVVFNWGDDEASMILSAVRSAMAEHARVLVIDHVLGDGDAADPVRLNDLSLMAMGGKARGLPGWDRLAAGAGLEVLGSPGSCSGGGPWSSLVLGPA